jgi:hypothetical protein
MVAKPHDEDIRKRMFFCPYTGNKTMAYRGIVKAIFPGYDAQETQFYSRPQRTPENINYSFLKTDEQGSSVSFWIQDQYFMKDVIRTYKCFNCQAPQLYYAGNKTVMFSNKKDIKPGDSYNCANPLCELKDKDSLTFLGIMKIAPVAEYAT